MQGASFHLPGCSVWLCQLSTHVHHVALALQWLKGVSFFHSHVRYGKQLQGNGEGCSGNNFALGAACHHATQC
jgi:hypothetical protein